MSIGGLIARAALLKEQMKKKPCKRCGLNYNQDKEAQCPHCGNLDIRGLKALLEKKEREYQGNKRLGQWFLFTAVLILMLMTLMGSV